MSTKRLLQARDHFTAMAYRAQPKAVIVQHPVPDLAYAFVNDTWDVSSNYNNYILGSWTFNSKSHKINEQKKSWMNITATKWSSPAHFDKAVIRMFDRAAEKYDLCTNLAIAYRAGFNAFAFPENSFSIVCHPDNEDTIKTYYGKRSVEKMDRVFATKACKKTAHYVIPYPEFLGVLLCHKNFEMYNVGINPRTIIKVDHVGGYEPAMDSLDQETINAIKSLPDF